MMLAAFLQAYLSVGGRPPTLGYSVDHFVKETVIWRDGDDGQLPDAEQAEAERELCQGDMDALVEQGILREAERPPESMVVSWPRLYVANPQEDWPPAHRARYDAWYEAEQAASV